MSKVESRAFRLLPRLTCRGVTMMNCGRAPMAPDRQENDTQ
ncbi:hypothetical protein [Rhizobium etli]|nr:hypothetical protein [Rhizobium etli]